MTLAGLVLAAGGGSRFGRPKALVSLDGELLVMRAVRTLTLGGCDPVITVLGAAADEVTTVAALPHSVVNPDWASGLGSSLRCGLRSLPQRAEAVVISLADQPLIRPEAVTRLAEAWSGGAVAAVATYATRPRNPVLLDRAVWPAVAAAASGDTGARPWLAAHPDLVSLVPCDDIGSAYDIDTPADLAAVQVERAQG